MSLRLIVALFFLNSIVLFSQSNVTKHTVMKGETISGIAEQYGVSLNEIYKLNPKAKNLLKLNSVLLIPDSSTKRTISKSKTTINNFEKEHEVLAKETLYGITKQYGISLKDLYEVNPTLESSELKIGQKIIIPVKASSVGTTASQFKKASEKTKLEVVEKASPATEELVREVLPKETKYSIARQYGITVKELDHANPELKDKTLQVGQKITVPANNGLSTAQKAIVTQQIPELPKEKATEIQSEIKASIAETVVVPQPSGVEIPGTGDIVREVLPKETKYGIAKQYGITVQELENQNPGIKNGFPVGYQLTIRRDNLSNENVSDPIVEGNKAKSVKIKNNSEQITSTESSNLESKKEEAPALGSNDFLDQLVGVASENIGTRYRTGGTTKDGFDCSGLMCTTFGAFNVKLPRTSFEQSNFGTRITTEEAQKGDLIFFKTNGRGRINHVGMVVEVLEGEIKFIHASVHDGVIISSTKERYYERNFSQINRVLE